MRYIYYILTIFFFFSCSSEFSKYEKRGRNDCENNFLKGNVKEVVYFRDNGSILSIDKFNKWGYYVESIAYNINNDIDEVKKYSYNDYGNLVKKEISSDGQRIIYTYEYNPQNQLQNIWEESFTPNSSVGTKSIVKNYEYEYDDFGNIYKKIIRSENSTPNSNYLINILNMRGDILEEYEVDSNAKLILRRKNSYNGKDRTSFDGYYSDGTIQVHSDYFYTYRNKEKVIFQSQTLYPLNPNYNHTTNYHYDKIDNEVTMIEDIYEDFTTKYFIEEEYDEHKNWIRRTSQSIEYRNNEIYKKDSLEHDMRKITYYE